MMDSMRLYLRNGVYYVEIRRGVVRSLKTRDRARADRLFREIRRRYLEGKLADLTGETSMTLARYRDEFLAWAQQAQPRRTREMNALALRRLVEVAGGSTRLDRIGRKHVDRMVADDLAAGLRPASVNNHIRHARAALAKAVEWGYLQRNPLAGVKQIKQDQRPPRFLPREDFQRFLDAFGSPQKRALALAYVSTGRRASEILSLQWQDIDLDRDSYWLRKSKRGRGEWFPVNSLFRAALLQMGPRDLGPVFPWRHRNSAYRIIKAALREIGHPDLTLHDLRHTFASWQVMQGRDLRTVQTLLGHSNYRTTEIYAHLSPDHLREAAELKIGPVDLGGGLKNADKMHTPQRGESPK